MDPVEQACRQVLERLPAAGRLLVGFSGGLDSTVLLHALAGRRASGSRPLIAVHVDHGLQEASADWAAHCAQFASMLSVQLEQVRVQVEPGANLEARARRARYHAFANLLVPGDVLALAHHRDDVEESLLLHLFQGRGMFGMPRRRALGSGVLIRPLLALPRSVLRSYAETHELTGLTDPSNLDPALDRNFLRQHILPPLRNRFPELGRRLDRVSRQVAGTARALTEALALERNPLPLAVLDGLSRTAAASVLRHWLIRHDAALGVSDAALREFLGQLQAPGDRQPQLELAVGELRRHRRELHLVTAPPTLLERYPLDVPGSLALPHGRLSVSEAAGDGASDADAGAGGPGELVLDPRPPVVVTFAPRLEPGARLRVRGHPRKPRELMRLAAVPAWQRDSLPLLEDSAGLLAIAGVAVRDPLGEAPSRRFCLRWEPSAAVARDS